MSKEKPAEPAKPLEGWGKPSNMKKFHYFHDGRSLCGRVMYLGPHLEPHNGKINPEDCAECNRRIVKRFPPKQDKDV
jgi:hypothetical protein